MRTIPDWPWKYAAPTEEEACHVLFEFDNTCYPPGEFVHRLLLTMIHADQPNLNRLALAFPGYASAVYAYKQTYAGRSELQLIAKLAKLRGDTSVDH